MQREDAIIWRFGPIEIDVPRSVGYYAGVGVAAATGLIEPPLAVFIGLVPFFKMLNVPPLPLPGRFFGHVLEGAAKPVGSDADGVIRAAGDESP